MKQTNFAKRIAMLTAVFMLIPCFAACGAMSEGMMDKGAYNYSADTSAPAEYEMFDSDLSYSSKFDSVAGESYTGDSYNSSVETSVSGNTSSPQSQGRKLIKTVTMDLETREFDAFIKEMDVRVLAMGGYIETSSIDGGRYNSNSYYTRSASVTVRIPAERLDEFCNGIAGISNVVYRHENTSDVTLRYYDTESHMKALQSEYDTLVGILEKCTKLEDVISVQSRITEVLYQIESYKTTLNNYDSLVAYSTVTMRIEEVKEETIVTEQTIGQRISHGVKGTMQDIREDGESLLVWFTSNLPYFVIWSVMIVVAVLVIRGLVRRSRKKRSAKKNATAVATSAENQKDS